MEKKNERNQNEEATIMLQKLEKNAKSEEAGPSPTKRLEAISEEKKESFSSNNSAPLKSDQSKKSNKVDPILSMRKESKENKAQRITDQHLREEEKVTEEQFDFSKYSSIIFESVMKYFDNLSKPELFVEEPEIDLIFECENWINKVKKALLENEFIPEELDPCYLIDEIEGLKPSIDFLKKQKEEDFDKKKYRTNEKIALREKEKACKQLFRDCVNNIKEYHKKAQTFYFQLLGNKKPSLETKKSFEQKAKDLYKPLEIYLNFMRKKDKKNNFYSMIRHILLSMTHEEFRKHVFVEFVNSFKGKTSSTNVLYMKEFTQFLNIVIAEFNDAEFIKDIFRLMKVELTDIKAKAIVYSAQEGKKIEDLTVYKLAFSDIRACIDYDENKDQVSFPKFLPYLYCFALAFQIKSMRDRCALYNRIHTWIIEAFEELLQRHEKTSDTINPNAFTYSQICEALTILNQKHSSYFGTKEYCIE